MAFFKSSCGRGSYVGMVIHSTTLDTQQKVIEQYGGTTWVKIEGRFLLGQSSSYAINSTGGEATHTLTVNEIPSHTHNLYRLSSSVSNKDTSAGSNYGEAIEQTSPTGGGQAHNNMPPYKVVYIWERTA